MSSFETTEDDETWSAWLTDAGVDDVYYSARYARIWAREERGGFVGIRYESGEGSVLYPLLLVSLDSLPGGAGLHEARTPYDFGGPLARAGDLEEIHAGFREACVEWFRSCDVVCEFARIHPLAEGGRPADAKLHAENFTVDVTIPHDDLFSSQHRRHRRAVRSFIQRHGEPDVISEISPEEAAAFMTLYEVTMDRVGAGRDYYFTPDTLADLASLDEMTLIRAASGDDSWGAALFLRSGDDLFYFLGASESERPTGTNNAIFDAAIRHARRQGLQRLHLGGGSESLREFKAQIASGKVPYYVLQRIVDEPRYSALCEASGVSDSGQFPAFRSKLVEQRGARAQSSAEG